MSESESEEVTDFGRGGGERERERLGEIKRYTDIRWRERKSVLLMRERSTVKERREGEGGAGGGKKENSSILPETVGAARFRGGQKRR